MKNNRICLSDDSTSKHAGEVLAEIYRKMTPQKKLEVAFGLYHSAWKLKSAGLRMLHPDWTEEDIANETKKVFGNART
jgi:hypothetical protein